MVQSLESMASALMTALAGAAPRDGPSEVEFFPDPAAPPGPQDPVSLPVLRWLPALAAQAPASARPVLDALQALAPHLTWRQTYTSEESDEAFLSNYGWTELVGAKGLFHDPTVSTGFLLLGADTFYPPHSHPAIERYLPISGVADWYDEDQGWRPVAPLNLILHRSGVRHAMRTGGEPLLAYFHWSGPGVAVRSRLV
jgi:hypothetical protein